MALSDEARAEVVELAATASVIAAELYSAFLSVKVPDAAGRGITNFNGTQAFDLTQTMMAYIAESSGV